MAGNDKISQRTIQGHSSQKETTCEVCGQERSAPNENSPPRTHPKLVAKAKAIAGGAVAGTTGEDAAHVQ
jgi:hypothetical protein